jgi:hypothetical protein
MGIIFNFLLGLSLNHHPPKLCFWSGWDHSILDFGALVQGGFSIRSGYAWSSFSFKVVCLLG